MTVSGIIFPGGFIVQLILHYMLIKYTYVLLVQVFLPHVIEVIIILVKVILKLLGCVQQVIIIHLMLIKRIQLQDYAHQVHIVYKVLLIILIAHLILIMIRLVLIIIC